jgi:pyruvate/2-oxoglutarate dehydrogenase complex dihydrolipoamide dehydrogenase (E3) component
VTVIQVEPTFIGREDEEVASVVEADFLKRGLKLIKSAKTLSFEEKNGVVTTNIEADGKPLAIEGEAVLVATGRRPNVEGLDLAKAGVNLTPRGAIAVNEHNQTSVNNIYAAGDVVGGLQFTYISLDDYRIIVSALVGGPRTNANRGNVPYSVFIDPTLSRLGLTEKEARDKGFEVLVARLPANAIPKALILGQTNGLLKVVIDAKNHEILGAHLYCVNSHEMINELKMAMDNHIPYEYLRDAIYTHPTMMEAFNDLFSNVK